MKSSRRGDLANLTGNQRSIFKCIFNKPRSKEEISSALNLAHKTVSNNLPLMARMLQEHDIIKYIDADGESLFAIRPHKKWFPNLRPKIYTYDRSPVHPYMVVNLPDPPNGCDHWELYPFGDWHYGASECDYQAIDNAVDHIANNPIAIAVLMGDLTENASKESVADAVFRQIIMPQQQQEDVAAKSAKIAHCTLAAIGGNHGERSVKSVYLNPDKNIADSIEVEFFGGMLYLDIICQEHKWEFLILHGVTGATTLAGRLNAIHKKNTFHTADIFLMGHTHDVQSPSDIEITRDPKTMRLVERDRSYVLTGGFLKPHVGYANKKGYPPLPIGMPVINLMTNGSSEPGSYQVISGRNTTTGKVSILNEDPREKE